MLIIAVKQTQHRMTNVYVNTHKDSISNSKQNSFQTTTLTLREARITDLQICGAIVT